MKRRLQRAVPSVKKTKPSEKDIENAILQALQFIPESKFWKNQSVGIYDPTRKTFRSRSRYQIKGVSDILGIWRGRMVCIEVKSAKGRLSPEQASFLEEMRNLGALSLVARSVSDVLHALKSPCESTPRTPEDQI